MKSRHEKKGKSILVTLLYPMFLVVALQVLVFLFMMVTQNVPDQMEESAYSVLDTTSHAQMNSLYDRLLAARKNLATFEPVIREQILSPALAEFGSIDGMASSQKTMTELSENLVSLIRRGGVTGAFFIMNTEDAQEKAAVYLRDLDPETISTNNGDIMAELGSAGVMKSMGITLDSDWSPRLAVDSDTDLRFYEKPFAAAQSYPDLAAEDLGYWAGNVSLSKNGLTVITYSMPVRDEDYGIVGVLGIEISMNYLRTKLGGEDLNAGGMGGYLIGIREEGEEEIKPIFAGSAYLKSSIGSRQSFGVELVNERLNIYKIADREKEEKLCAMYALKLYNANTPFESEEWLFAGIVQKNVLRRSIRSIENSLLYAGITALAVGILAVLVTGRYFAKPISKLLVNLRNSNPSKPIRLDKLKINEIDELAEAIENLSRDVADYSSRLNQIIEMAGLPIGAIDYNEEEERLRCFGNINKILVFDEENGGREPEDEHEIMNKLREFDRRIIKRSGEESGVEDLMYLAGGKERWVRVTSVRVSKGILFVLLDVTQEMEEKRKIEYERDYDVLTNLLNRRAFKIQAEELLETEEKKGRPIASVMWDLDNLKFINDIYGHDYGDKYIQEAARVFGRLNEYGAVVSRRSGDEFTALLYGRDSVEEYRKLIYDVHSSLSEESFVLPDGKLMKVRASGGIAWFPDDSGDFEGLQKCADFAMYDAKRKEKGSIQEFSQELYHRDKLLVNGSEELNRLLEERDVHYAYQPIVSAVTGEIFAYEALMRPHSTILTSPYEVMRLARAQSKLYHIEQLTWFLALQEFPWDQTGDIKLFVNSVPNTRLTMGDCERLKEQYQDKLHRIVVEMIESEQIDSSCMAFKYEIKEQWECMTALDDFGTGYSTESALLKMQLDFVKVDISMISGIDQDSAKQQLLKSVLEVSKSRNYRVIAEGVETKEEMECLIQMGVDLLQGYYLARPAFVPEGIKQERVEEIRDANRRRQSL